MEGFSSQVLNIARPAQGDCRAQAAPGLPFSAELNSIPWSAKVNKDLVKIRAVKKQEAAGKAEPAGTANRQSGATRACVENPAWYGKG